MLLAVKALWFPGFLTKVRNKPIMTTWVIIIVIVAVVAVVVLVFAKLLLSAPQWKPLPHLSLTMTCYVCQGRTETQSSYMSIADPVLCNQCMTGRVRIQKDKSVWLLSHALLNCSTSKPTMLNCTGNLNIVSQL